MVSAADRVFPTSAYTCGGSLDGVYTGSNSDSSAYLRMMDLPLLPVSDTCGDGRESTSRSWTVDGGARTFEGVDGDDDVADVGVHDLRFETPLEVEQQRPFGELTHDDHVRFGAGRLAEETPRGLFLYAHTERRAIFRGAEGELCREDGDSALRALVSALAPRRCVELAADDSGGERVVLLGFGSTAADLASMQRRG